jgi:hypothetical protein
VQIHTDKLTSTDLWREAPAGCYLDVAIRGSRKRLRRFDVSISADEGTDAHGLKRVYARNTGKYGGQSVEGEKAATWLEWGDWIVALFKLDPDAIIGYYEGPRDFVEQTQKAAPHRPAREDAQRHADRWAGELEPATIS